MSTVHALRRLAATAALGLAMSAGTVAATAAPAQAAPLPPIGSPLCHVSPTVGLQCGALTQVNLTIQFPQGVIHGAFRYQACVTARDNGIPVFNPATGAVVGTVIGGTGNCRFGASTFGLPS